MQINRSLLPLFLALVIMLGACGTKAQGGGQQVLTIWSFFPNKAMEEVIKNYEATHPNVEVIHTGFEFLALPPEFRKRTAQGLGPDAVIVTDRELPNLIEGGLIENLEAYNVDLSRYYPKARVSIYDEEKNLYGVPIAFQTMGLCYNRTLVEEPAETLEEWLEQARNGRGLSIEPLFLNGMWGIGAFGGAWFDYQNRFILNAAAVEDWFTWLENTRLIPTIYVDDRRSLVYDLFTQGKIAYYPCWTFEYGSLRKLMEDKLGVALLPRGTQGPAAPMLETDTLAINVHASAKKKDLALNFAEFITRRNQQLIMVSSKEHVIAPVNIKTAVDERLLPVISVFSQSAQNAIPFPASKQYSSARLRFYGDRMYTQVVQGLFTPERGVQEFIDTINSPVTPDEEISVSVSAAGDEVQEKVLVDVVPDYRYLLKLFRVQREALKRPVVLFQLAIVVVVFLLTRVIAKYLVQWIKTLLTRLMS